MQGEGRGGSLFTQICRFIIILHQYCILVLHFTQAFLIILIHLNPYIPRFLEPGNELNLFYKLVLSAVKRKIIIVESAPKPVTPVVPKPAPQPAPQPYNQPPQPSFQPPQAQWPEQPGAHNQYHQQLIQFGANQVQQSAPHQPQVQLQAPPQFSVPQQQPPPQRGGGQWGKIAGEHLHQGEAKKGYLNMISFKSNSHIETSGIIKGSVLNDVIRNSRPR